MKIKYIINIFINILIIVASLFSFASCSKSHAKMKQLDPSEVQTINKEIEYPPHMQIKHEIDHNSNTPESATDLKKSPM